ncbi:BTB/POZ domain-containing protein [Paramyrothecium foliicola]|nr:BTB/POZ domain-containing protein [Paramyrothecium foliicola]
MHVQPRKMVLKKYELEGKLHEESRMIKSGVLRDENPLDTTPEFRDFLTACRHGDLRRCQELINNGVNINGKDSFDYTPLIIVSRHLHPSAHPPRSPRLENMPLTETLKASLCGHYELVQLLLESGALAERNTFQGERCIYNALNDRIRNLLLKYDFSKSSDPYVYWSTHISTLLTRSSPQTSDISLIAGSHSFELHKFLLSSRTPYFGKKLEAQPDTATWKLAPTIPVEAFEIVLRYIYLGDVPKDLVPSGAHVTEEEVIKGLDKISKQLEVEQLWEAIMAGSDRRLARQRYQDEVARALAQITDFFERNVLGHKMVVDTDRVSEVKWLHDNSIFADILLRADEPLNEEAPQTQATQATNGLGIPIGPPSTSEDSKPKRKSVLYPVHKAMLIRSEYFDKMLSGDFVESKRSEHLHVVTVDCIPEVLELVLAFLYTETTACPLEHALDLLYAADMLFLDGLKSKAAQAISTLGSGNKNVLVDRTHVHANGEVADEGAASGAAVEMEPINIYDVIHAAWDLRVQRLEEFAARYLAYRLEDYIDEPEFQDLIQESAERLQKREETDTIELLDDIRYYLSERFRLRFEDAGLDEMMDEEGEINAAAAAAIADAQAEEAFAELAPAPGIDGEAASAKAKLPEGGNTVKVKADHVLHSLETASQEVGSKVAQSEDAVRTLDGATAEDEFVSDAINYQILLGKIDTMLDRLKLDA